MVTLEFFDEPADFLAVAGDRLSADPVLSMVVTRVTVRTRDDDAAGVVPPAGVPRWWVVVREGDEVVGLAMRTAPFAPFAPYLLPMPEAGARELARALHARGERAEGANGALPAVGHFADETARLTGGTSEVGIHLRLFELGELVPPRPVSGELRQARADDLELVHVWLQRFMADADEQAGRPRGTSPHAVSTDDLARRVERGDYWLWVDGGPVSLTAGSAPAFGVSGIGPVFTPVGCRGRGYASAAVAAVARRLRDGGARVCLFTDQANPTSNQLYQRLGFEPVADTANFVVRRLVRT